MNEVANMLVFLASNESKFINGTATTHRYDTPLRQ